MKTRLTYKKGDIQIVRLMDKIEYLKRQQDVLFDEDRYGCRYLNRNRYREIYGESLKVMEEELKLKELKQKEELKLKELKQKIEGKK